MCLAIPARIIEIAGDEGVVEIGGTRRKIVLSLVDGAAVGRYVLLHAGYAIEIIDEAEAQELAALLREILEAAPPEDEL